MIKIETALTLDDAALSQRAAAAAEQFVTRAAQDGSADVAYAELDSPVGRLLVAATERGLVRLAYLHGEASDDVLEDLARKVSPRIVESPHRTDEIRRELDEYFEHARSDFDLPVDWSLTRGFSSRVLHETASIPYGEVRTYTEMAQRAGSPKAVRAAGNALARNPIAIVVPCHRVLRTGGTLGGYGGGLDNKRRLLDLEGAGVSLF